METATLATFGELSPELAEAVAIGDSANKPKVMGMGIYLEFPNAAETQTTQILITPKGTTEKGVEVDMAIIARSVSDWSPRKQWRINMVRPNLGLPTEPTTIQAQAIDMADQIERTIKRQMLYGLKTLRNGRPIVFEMTDVDFTDVAQWKVPASALRRIQKARVSVGFPEKLFNNLATPTTI